MEHDAAKRLLNLIKSIKVHAKFGEPIGVCRAASPFKRN